MKTKSLLLIVLFFSALTIKAEQITVSNDNNTPAQYHNLQTAISNASPGDTILIGPSVLDAYGYPTTYGSITLNINLVLIGSGGYFPDGASTGTEKKVTKIDALYLNQTSASSGASGSKIIGIDVGSLYLYSGFSGSTYQTGGMSNVLIERCKINTISFSNNGYFATCLNDTIRNCIISSYISFNNQNTASYYGTKFNAISIENNIFDGAYVSATNKITSSGSSLDSVFVRNNLFLNRTSNCFSTVPHLVVENNIFWKAEPAVSTTPSGVTFNNNLCYSTTANLPGTGNIGSGNLNNSNPLFLNYPAQGGAFDCAYNFNLPANSPAKSAGTDNSDIGIHGGASPFDDYCAEPKVPTIKSITMPANASSVPQGGNLNITFKAKNRD